MPDDHSNLDEFDGPSMPTQAELETLLDADETDVAAGRVFAQGPVLVRLRAMAERIRYERRLKEASARPQV